MNVATSDEFPSLCAGDFDEYQDYSLEYETQSLPYEEETQHMTAMEPTITDPTALLERGNDQYSPSWTAGQGHYLTPKKQIRSFNNRPHNRQSRKHMDRHTRPYICTEAKCNNLTFGEKAGLHRHRREVHGLAKLFCPFPSCRRYSRGFPRQRNLDVHLKTQHKGLGLSEEGDVVLSDELQNSGFEGGEGEIGLITGGGEIDGGKMMCVDMSSLHLKLRELEVEKRELEICQSRVDEDILALKRVLQIVSA
ncbi:hypothetical protein DL95DRAFT_440621 [Leptodontidium sp. 2 PMI_412]|nr:hypothetical protein DL95DRAFT_440621 [Leptodontidium sp. 2 PMI_412]